MKAYKFLRFPSLRVALALSGSPFSTPAIGSRVVRARVFHPCRYVPVLSGPAAFSTPADLFPCCQVLRFHPCHAFLCCQVLRFLPPRPYPRFLVSTCQVLRFQRPNYSNIAKSCHIASTFFKKFPGWHPHGPPASCYDACIGSFR